MAIEELLTVVRPPSAPVCSGPMERRPEIEKTLGTRLPDDFFQYAVLFGSGRFGSIEVFNPFASNYFESVEMVAGCYRELKRDEGDEYIPYDLFPQSPGYLPWATSWNGHCFFWITEGQPNQWPVALVVGRQADVYERVDMSMTTFLARVLSSPLPCVLWDLEWQSTDLIGKVFTPLGAE